jgi:hypothetical protein
LNTNLNIELLSQHFQFEADAQLVMAYTQFQLKQLIASMEAFSHSFTSYGMLTAPTSGEIDWYFQTLPEVHFEEIAEHVFAISHANVLWTAPMVKNVSLWLDGARVVAENLGVETIPTMFAYGKLHHDMNGESIKMGKLPISGGGPFTPIHQLFPFPPPFISTINGSIIDYDTSSEIGVNDTNTFVSTLRDKPVLSGLLAMPLFRDAYPETLDPVEPLSLFVQPIHSDFSKTTIVSYIQSIFEWEFLFSKIPFNGVGIHCYVENTCGDSFAYVLNRDSVNYVGVGDAHDEAYDKQNVSSIIGLLDSSEAGLQDALTAGVCVYRLTIHPTQEFRNSFNSYADVYTLIIGTTMTVMVGAFFIYDQ